MELRSQTKKMAIDTNIIIRVLTGDDIEQSPIAKKLISEIEDKLYVFSIIVTECVYVLKNHYGYSRESISHALLSLFSVDDIEFEDSHIVYGALHDYADKNVDFADALIAWKSKTSNMPVITWNKKHFKKLDCEFYSPEEIMEGR